MSEPVVDYPNRCKITLINSMDSIEARKYIISPFCGLARGNLQCPTILDLSSKPKISRSNFLVDFRLLSMTEPENSWAQHVVLHLWDSPKFRFSIKKPKGSINNQNGPRQETWSMTAKPDWTTRNLPNVGKGIFSICKIRNCWDCRYKSIINLVRMNRTKYRYE